MARQKRTALKTSQLLNRYYKISRFYTFLKDTAIKATIVIAIFGLILLALEYFFLDFNAILENFVASYSAFTVFISFFISEIILGLLPPEIFIAWAAKTANSWFYLFILATLSYLGGIVAYFIGNRLYLIPAVKNHIENKISHHIVNLRKWGGLFVFIGAMLPIPHSIVSLASGLIKYKFSSYLLWALFRYIRFAIYASVVFHIF